MGRLLSLVSLIGSICITSLAQTDSFRLPDATTILLEERSWTLDAQAISKIEWLKGLILARAAFVAVDEDEHGNQFAVIKFDGIRPSLLNLIVKIAQENWTPDDVKDCLREGQNDILGQLELWGVDTPDRLIDAMPIVFFQGGVWLQLWQDGVCIGQVFYLDCPVCRMRWWLDQSTTNLDNFCRHLREAHSDCKFQVELTPFVGATGWVQPAAQKVSTFSSHEVFIDREDWGLLLLMLRPNDYSKTHLQTLFRKAAYLSHKMPHPDMRRMIAAYVVRLADPLFKSVPDWVLNFALLRFQDFLSINPKELGSIESALFELRLQENALGQLMLVQFQENAADCIACRVMRNVFPLYTRHNAELERRVPYWRQRVMSHRANIAREVMRGVRNNALPQALALPVRNRLVMLLSAIPLLDFGIPLIRTVIGRYSSRLQES